MSKLSTEQLAQVEQWATEGASLNLIQDRLKSEFGITLTYMEARLLLLDVGVTIKSKPKPEPEPTPEPELEPEPEPVIDDEEQSSDALSGESVSGQLKVTGDQIAIPGALVSGKVTFSDGQSGSWYIDQMGRPGLTNVPPTYRPPQEDIPMFQQELERVLRENGY